MAFVTEKFSIHDFLKVSLFKKDNLVLQYLKGNMVKTSHEFSYLIIDPTTFDEEFFMNSNLNFYFKQFGFFSHVIYGINDFLSNYYLRRTLLSEQRFVYTVASEFIGLSLCVYIHT